MSKMTLVFIVLLSFGSFGQEYKNTNTNNTENEVEPKLKTKVDSVALKKNATSKGLRKKEIKAIELNSAPAQNLKSLDEVQMEGAAIQESSIYKSSSYQFEQQKKLSSVQRTQRTPSEAQQSEMDAAVVFFETNAPASFEYHYFKYVSSNYNVDEVSHLYNAEQLKPANSDVHVHLAAYNIIKENSDSAQVYMDKLKESSRLTENVIHYTEDVLLSAPQNGTLITHGFDDTYGVWYNQNKNNIRTDVQLVSLDFMQSDFYRKQLKNKGYKLPESNVVDVDYMNSFCQLNASKTLSVSLTTPKEYFKPIQSKLYVTGLVFEYRNDAFENYERNDMLWNTQLKKHLVNNATDEKSKQLSSNYLPMLLQLQKVYDQLGEEKKMIDVDDASNKVSVQCKKYEQVQKLKSSY